MNRFFQDIESLKIKNRNMCLFFKINPPKEKYSSENLYGCQPKNRGKTPKWMVKIMENPIKHGMIWGVFPLFLGSTPMTHDPWYQPWDILPSIPSLD